jgi:hypothetical protein
MSPCQGEGQGFESLSPLVSWRRSQVVRQGSAKPPFVGSSPTVAFTQSTPEAAGILMTMPVFVQVRGGGEMADAVDLKSSVLTDVWVRIPPALLD